MNNSDDLQADSYFFFFIFYSYDELFCTAR